MLRTMLKSKIHRATVTEANLDYAGSITIDSELLKAADILPHEQVQVVNLSNGVRLETYAIPGRANSRVICINGAAARLVQKGDLVIIMSYAVVSDEEARKMRPKVVCVDGENHIVKIENRLQPNDAC